jgi:hypothetical protein
MPPTLHLLTAAATGGLLLATLAEIAWQLLRHRHRIATALIGAAADDDAADDLPDFQGARQ